MTGDPRKFGKKRIAKEEAVRELGPEAFERTFASRYDVGELIGWGGMGYVFKGRHKTLDRQEALKVPKPELIGRSFLRRFEREAKTLALLNHRHIVAVYHVETDPNPDHRLSYIAMEYVSGARLQQHLRGNEARLSIAELLDIFDKVAIAIDHAHSQHVVHRDIKPENILIETATANPKLVDFGLARAHTDTEEFNITVSGSSAGFTPTYASPEQIAGGEVGAPSDIYSLAVTLYYCLCREYPYDFSSVSSCARAHISARPIPIHARNPRWPAALNDAILPGLEKEADDRPVRAQHLVNAIAQALAPYRQATLSEFFRDTGVRGAEQTTKTSPPHPTPAGATAGHAPSTAPRTELRTEHVETVLRSSPPDSTRLAAETELRTSPPRTILARPAREQPPAPPAPPTEIEPARRNPFVRALLYLVLLLVFAGVGLVAAVRFDLANPEGPSWSKDLLVLLDMEQYIPSPPCDSRLAGGGTEMAMQQGGGESAVEIRSLPHCDWSLSIVEPDKPFDSAESPWLAFDYAKSGAGENSIGLAGRGDAVCVVRAGENPAPRDRYAAVILFSAEGVEIDRIAFRQFGIEPPPPVPVVKFAQGAPAAIPPEGGTVELLLENADAGRLALPPFARLARSVPRGEGIEAALVTIAPNDQWEERTVTMRFGDAAATTTQPPLPRWRVEAEGLEETGDDSILRASAVGGSWPVAIETNAGDIEISSALPPWIRFAPAGRNEAGAAAFELTVLPADGAAEAESVVVASLPRTARRLVVAREKSTCGWTVVESAGFGERAGDAVGDAVLVVRSDNCPEAEPPPVELVVESGLPGWIRAAVSSWEKRPNGYAFSWNVAENLSLEPRRAIVGLRGAAQGTFPALEIVQRGVECRPTFAWNESSDAAAEGSVVSVGASGTRISYRVNLPGVCAGSPWRLDGAVGPEEIVGAGSRLDGSGAVGAATIVVMPNLSDSPRRSELAFQGSTVLSIRQAARGVDDGEAEKRVAMPRAEAREAIARAWAELRPLQTDSKGRTLGALPWIPEDTFAVESALATVAADADPELSTDALVALRYLDLRSRRTTPQLVARRLRDIGASDELARWITNLEPKLHSPPQTEPLRLEYSAIEKIVLASHDLDSFRMREVLDCDFAGAEWLTLLAVVDCKGRRDGAEEERRMPALIRLAGWRDGNMRCELFGLRIRERDREGRPRETTPTALLQLRDGWYLVGTEEGLYFVDAVATVPTILRNDNGGGACIARLGKPYDPARKANDRYADLARASLSRVCAAVARNGDGKLSFVEFLDADIRASDPLSATSVSVARELSASPAGLVDLHFARRADGDVLYLGTIESGMLGARTYRTFVGEVADASFVPRPLAPNFAGVRGLEAANLGEVGAMAANSWGTAYLAGTGGRLVALASPEGAIDKYGGDPKTCTLPFQVRKLASDPDGNLALVGADAVEIRCYPIPSRLAELDLLARP